MLRNIWSIVVRECRHIISQPRILIIMLGFPLLGIALVNIMYQEHTVKQIPTAIYDMDGSALSRSLAGAFSNTERLKVIASVNSEAEMRGLIESREVIAAVVIPRDYSRDINRGDGSTIMLVVNGTNFLYSNAVLSDASEIAATIASLMQGSSPVSAALPAQLSTRIWYNPTFNYANFLVPGLAATAVQQVLLLYASLAMTREKATGKLKELLQQNYSASQILLGKSIPYFILSLLTLNAVLALCHWVFHIPFIGSIANLLLLQVLFLGCITALAIFISTLCSIEVQAVQLAMLFAIPSFLFCGYTWPLESMPVIARAIAAAMPLTYFASNLRDIALMGLELNVMYKDIIVLCALNAILLPASFIAYKWQARRQPF